MLTVLRFCPAALQGADNVYKVPVGTEYVELEVEMLQMESRRGRTFELSGSAGI